MVDKMIIDADLCIKLGGSQKHQFLYAVLPLVSNQIYMHTHAYSEVMLPPSAVKQLKALVDEGTVVLVNENNLDKVDRVIYDAAYKNLEKIMINPKHPNKNKGETCSLAYAKATGIPIFATDEMNLQPIIDSQLNTGINDITCLRIVDIVKKAKKGEVDVPRKVCKALWIIAGKSKETFDDKVWPVTTE